MTTGGTTIATIAAPVKNLHLQLYETNASTKIATVAHLIGALLEAERNLMSEGCNICFGFGIHYILVFTIKLLKSTTRVVRLIC